jgi:hypothetical protein
MSVIIGRRPNGNRHTVHTVRCAGCDRVYETVQGPKAIRERTGCDACTDKVGRAAHARAIMRATGREHHWTVAEARAASMKALALRGLPEPRGYTDDRPLWERALERRRAS